MFVFGSSLVVSKMRLNNENKFHGLIRFFLSIP